MKYVWWHITFASKHLSYIIPSTEMQEVTNVRTRYQTGKMLIFKTSVS